MAATKRYIGGAADAKRRQAQQTDARVRQIHEARIAAVWVDGRPLALAAAPGVV